MPITRSLAALATLIALAACQDTGERSVSMLRPGSSFTVARIDGAPAPEGVTLEVGEDGRISGAAPCNSYSAQLTEQDGAMAIGGAVMTRRACLDQARTAAETRFAIALGSITAARRAADGIALIDPEGKERLGLAAAGEG